MLLEGFSSKFFAALDFIHVNAFLIHESQCGNKNDSRKFDSRNQQIENIESDCCRTGKLIYV